MKIQSVSASAVSGVTTKSSSAGKTDNIAVQNSANVAKSVTSAQILSQMPNVSFKRHSHDKHSYDKKDDYEDMSYDAYVHSLQLSEAEKNPKKEEFRREDFDDDYAAYCSSCVNASHYPHKSN